MDSEDKHFLSKHFSIGDIISLVTLLVVFSAGYGRLDAQVVGIAQKVDHLSSRDITPGAAQRISALESENNAFDRELTQMRSDALEFRREMRAQLDRIEAKLDNHDSKP